MFHTPGTRSGLRKRPGYPSSNGQLIYSANGTLAGSNLTISNTGALTGNGFGLTILANSGIVSNSTGVFANLAASPGLAFVSGGLAVSPAGSIAVGATTAVNTGTNGGLVANSTGLWVLPDSAIKTSATGTQVNTSGTSSGLSTTGGLNVVVVNGVAVGTTGLYVNADASFTVNATGLHINATGALTFQDLTLNGNLAVLGTLTTINTTSVIVENNMIELAYNQANTTSFTDSVDSGYYTAWGNTTAADTFYGGMARIHNSGLANVNPLFVLFGSTTKPTGTVTYSGSATSNLGFLEAYLSPYGAGTGAFVVNSSAITITCNSTLGVALTANSLSLTTQLAVSNIAGGTDGQVLQWFTGATSATYGMLDGGTFKNTFRLNTRSTNAMRLMKCRNLEDTDLCIYGMIENMRGFI